MDIVREKKMNCFLVIKPSIHTLYTNDICP
jgi:hypothetical protein